MQVILSPEEPGGGGVQPAENLNTLQAGMSVILILYE